MPSQSHTCIGAKEGVLELRRAEDFVVHKLIGNFLNS